MKWTDGYLNYCVIEFDVTLDQARAIETTIMMVGKLLEEQHMNTTDANTITQIIALGIANGDIGLVAKLTRVAEYLISQHFEMEDSASRSVTQS